MADRFEQRPTSRPQGDRRTTDARRADESDDDPLIELARIVSGKGAFDQPPLRAERRREPQAPRAAVPSESDLARDLESELLSELQASFSMLQEPLTAASQPQAAAEPPPQQTAKIIQAPVGRRRQAPPPVEVVPPPVQVASPSPPPQRAERVSRATPVPPPERAAERPAIRPANDADFSDMQFRPTVAPQAPRARLPEPPPPPARPQTTSRWGSRNDPRLETERPVAPRPAARQPAPEPRQPAPRKPDYQDEAYDEPLSFQDDTYYEDDPEAFDLVPGYGDDELLPPYSEEELAVRPRRSGRGLAIVAGILAVVVAGGAAAIMLRSGDISGTSAPPIIAADPSPTKVTPETGTPVEDQGQAKAIYDRVVPGEDAAGSQLAEQDNGPVTDIAAATAGDDSDNPISRVILPGGPGIDGPAPIDAEAAADTGVAPTEGAPAMSSDGGAIQPIGPKKVRTVVVRPDGTILSSEAAPADGSAPEAARAASGETEPLPFSAEATPAPAPATPAPTPAASANGSDIAELESAGADGGRIAATEGGSTSMAAEPLPADPTPVAEAPVAPKPAPRETERAVASVDDSAPIDLGARSQPAAASGSGMLVQISSQRSEEAALSTYRDLQKRFPSILGSYEANIQRADLGAKGVYYRVRVGPFAAGDAQRLCDALKGAGGDCLLAQR